MGGPQDILQNKIQTVKLKKKNSEQYIQTNLHEELINFLTKICLTNTSHENLGNFSLPSRNNRFTAL